MQMSDRHHSAPSRRRSHRFAASLPVVLLALLALPVIFAQQPARKRVPKPPVVPTIPTADRNAPGRVFLEHADQLIQETGPDNTPRDYQILRGNVVFRKENMFMYCDSAFFYEKSNSLDAFSNVKMEQGDTLFVYADELNYNGMTEMAILFGGHGQKVRMVNRDVNLVTDQFEYDLRQNVGYYRFGGKLFDKQNTLTSMLGYYYPSTKNAFFYDNVKLESRNRKDTLWMYTDSLQYNTATHIATLLCPTRIISADGEINSSSGNYNTTSGRAFLFSRSTVVTRRGNTLTGDTLFYDRNRGYGEAFGNMVLTDSARQSALYGDYGFYNELTDSAFVTGDALAKEYSRKDTLYLHGDTINAYMLPDSSRLTNVFHRVRFYRVDLQGLCDSLSMTDIDSTLRMYRHPIVWTGHRQITGNLIEVHFNDSTPDRVTLPRSGIMAEHIAEDCFDQLAGKKMTAWLNDTTINRLLVEGNVQVIMFPMEKDSTYNKFNFTESSFLNATFRDNQIDSVLTWPETTGSMTPLYLAKRGSYFLPDFRWYESLRPLSPDEVFDYPEGMDELLSSPETSGRSSGSRLPDVTPPAPRPVATPAPQTDVTPPPTDEGGKSQ